jgi:hypothetical protein
MAQLRIFTGIVLVVAGASWTADAWAADSQPPKAAPAAAASTPTPCTDAWSFVATDCTLTWHGITVYGTVDAGFGWQSHGAPWDSRSAVGASYLIQKQNRGPRCSLAPNGLSNSTIGIKGTEPIGGNFSFVFALDAGFDPYSLRFSDGPGSIAANAGVARGSGARMVDLEEGHFRSACRGPKARRH